MNRGTKNKTVAQLEEAIQELGASIRISTSKEDITIGVTTLAKNYDKNTSFSGRNAFRTTLGCNRV